MGKTVIETRTVNRSPRESERAKLERVLVDGPAHSNAVRYAMVFMFVFAIIGVTLFALNRKHGFIYNEVNFAVYWVFITVAMTIFLYKFFYHSTRYNLRHELFDLESRPQSEVVIETIEDDDEFHNALNYNTSPAANAELITNKGNIPRHAPQKYARDYLFTGVQWSWMRAAAQRGDLYLRRDTSPAGPGWADLEKGCPQSGDRVTDRRNHFNKSTAALRRAGYIDHSGRWTYLGFDEFLELPHPNHDNNQNHVATSGDDRTDGQ